MKQYIRIFVLLATALGFFASCINSNDITGGYGKIKFSIGHNPSLSVKSTTAEAPDTFVVSTTDSDNIQVDELSGQYADFKKQEVIVPVGTYIIEAYNVTVDQAEEGRGVQRFYGSDTLDIAASSVNFADFTCTMTNARVSFTFDDTFKNAYDMESTDNPVKVVVSTSKNPSRTIEFNKDATLAEDDPQVAYFNADEENTVLNFTITARRKSNSEDKTFTQSIEIKPQSWYKMTVKATASPDADEVVVNVQ